MSADDSSSTPLNSRGLDRPAAFLVRNTLSGIVAPLGPSGSVIGVCNS